MSYAVANIPDDKNRALVGRDGRGRSLVSTEPQASCRRQALAWCAPSEIPGEQAMLDDVMVLMWCIVLDGSEYDYLIPTLLAMAASGFDKKSTVAYMRRHRCCTKGAARRLYQLHRTLLDTIFVLTNKDGGFLDLERIPFRKLTVNI